MKLLKRPQTKPAGGYSAIFHILLISILPLLLFALVRLEFTAFAFLAIVFSKWRMFALRMRHWPASIRANAVDIMVGFSVVAFMSLASNTQSVQVVWAVLYVLWLLLLKPRSGPLWIGTQAIVAQTVSLVAIFLIGNEANEVVLTLSVTAVTYLSARHFLAAFDEAMSRATAYSWSFFCASLTWLSSHWLLYYGPIAQPALIMTAIGYCLAAIYYLDHKDRLRKTLITQFVGLAVTIVLFILIFSDWSGDII
jgi:hypothetical protein